MTFFFSREQNSNSVNTSKPPNTSSGPMIGFGYDVHRLAPGESLVLGGVTMESKLGTVAHSDGDVLLHAIMDALLGALALGDIGLHFPDTSAEWRGADSVELLKHVHQLIRNEGAHIVNIDSTV